uniref:Kinesin-like protein n=1 Tax=Malurus cyaneus samueli TaxID=2593467 RepID=A0A8C5X6P7_9PASS
MVKERIRVYARVKPLGRRQQAGSYSLDDEESLPSLEITVPRDLADGFINNKREIYRFKFQKIFDQETKQDVVFDSIAKPVAECVLAGYNGTIFAYGQTGSGKTFTITGGAERYSDRGIIPRTLSYIFDQLQKDSSKVYTTHVSYLEIYNECGYDLLDPRHEASRMEDLPKVTIMEDSDQNIHLKNLSLQQATNEEEALNLLFLGDTNRMIAETPMNQASSRSHCIFTIHISSKEPGSATIRRSKLHLVDLAGSERVAKTGIGGQLLTEAKYINLSLHYLEQVIVALAEKNRSHIPYRNSMMTSVLRDSLGGNCMTTMIATLAMDKRNIDESISTCRFAQRVALIKNEAVLNEEIDPRLVRLKKEIQDLKDELALVTGKQRTSELSQEELLQLDELIETFLNDDDPDSSLDVGTDMRKIKYCFVCMKVFFFNIAGNAGGTLKITWRYTWFKSVKRNAMQLRDILVTMLKKEKKKARDALFQLNATSAGFTDLEQSPSMSLEESQSPSTCFSLREMSLGCQEAFEVFKWDHKLLLWTSYGHWLNLIISSIAVSNPSEGLTFDSVEENLRMQIEEEKKSYKAVYNRFKGLKVEIEHLQLLMEKMKMKLQKDFEVWWSEETKIIQQNVVILVVSSIVTSDFKTSNLNFNTSDYSTSVLSYFRTPPSSSTSIPLTGDSQTDADILAFIKARQNILQKKGKSCQKIGSQPKISSAAF